MAQLFMAHGVLQHGGICYSGVISRRLVLIIYFITRIAEQLGRFHGNLGQRIIS
jgi:hypothetical protein